MAWHHLGWKAVGFSEIDPFARAVLSHHYPDIPLFGDFTKLRESDYGTIDLLVGGTPCQSFSIAGLRKGLADDRGNLSLEFIRLAKASRARWVVWENVPGVLSIDGGRAFGSFLGGLAECGYGFAYRILDAQYFGVPQRRRRVFVVGYLGDWRPAAAVLFERECLRGDITPRRQARERIADSLTVGANQCGGRTGDFVEQDVAYTLEASSGGASGKEGRGLVTHTLRGDGFDASEDGTGRGTPLVAGTVSSKWAKGTGASTDDVSIGMGIGHDGDAMYTLQAAAQHGVAFDLRGRIGGAQFEGPHDTANIRAASGGSSRSYVMQGEKNASTQEANSGTILQELREAIGEEAFAKWGLGILDTLQQKEILREALHGNIFRPAPFSRNWAIHCVLSCKEDCREGIMQSLREAGCDGYTLQRQELSEQFIGKLGAYLSQLPQPGAQAERFMFDMWQASEGSGLLRQTLSAIQKIRQPNANKNQSTHSVACVRRLTVEECEFLQGFPRGYTQVPYRGRPAADAPRYKALGNSMAVPVMRWLGERIEIIERILGEDNGVQN